MNKKKKITLSVIATMLFALTLIGGLLLKQKQESKACFGYFSRVKLSKCDITLENKEFEWTGSAIKPEYTICFKGYQLEENVDYILTYRHNVDAGTATMVFKGINDFRGKVNVRFHIEGINIARDCELMVNNGQVYVYYNNELVDPRNYSVDKTVTKYLDYENDYAYYYNITTKYSVEGRGQYYGYDYAYETTKEKIYK